MIGRIIYINKHIEPNLMLLLSPRNNASSKLIEDAALETGLDCRRLSSWQPPEDLLGRVDIFAYGEPLFVALMAESYQSNLIEPHFNWLPSLPLRFVNRNVELTTLSEARARTTGIFAKPADDKCFPAGVYEDGKSITASNLLPDTIPVLISEIVQWVNEYRFFVLDRKVMTGSLYSEYGELAQTAGSAEIYNEAREFVESLLSDETLQIPPAAAIDVGLIKDRGWAIVESNPAFGSGIYFCEPKQVLPVLARSFVSNAKLTDEDKHWIIERQV